MTSYSEQGKGLSKMDTVLGELGRMFMLIGKQVTDETLIEWAKYLLDVDMGIDEIKYACSETVKDPDLNPYSFTIAKLMKNMPTKRNPTLEEKIAQLEGRTT